MQPEDVDVAHRFMTSSRIRLHYVERGTGPLVLLLHGFPESWWSYRRQIEPLADAGYRVVAPDQRGYAGSDKHGPYDIDTLVADIVELIAHLGEERAIVVGHDWGGLVAWHLAATRPDLVSKLAILNAPHPIAFRRALLTHPRQLARSWYVFFFQLPVLPERTLVANDGERIVAILRANAASPRAMDDEELEPFRRAILEPGAATAMLGWYRAAFWNLASRRTYPRIETPTRVIWGTADRSLGYDDVVPGITRHVCDLDLRTIDRAGHFVHAEAPERVNPLLLEHFAG